MIHVTCHERSEHGSKEFSFDVNHLNAVYSDSLCDMRRFVSFSPTQLCHNPKTPSQNQPYEYNINNPPHHHVFVKLYFYDDHPQVFNQLRFTFIRWFRNALCIWTSVGFCGIYTSPIFHRSSQFFIFSSCSLPSFSLYQRFALREVLSISGIRHGLRADS